MGFLAHIATNFLLQVRLGFSCSSSLKYAVEYGAQNLGPRKTNTTWDLLRIPSCAVHHSVAVAIVLSAQCQNMRPFFFPFFFFSLLLHRLINLISAGLQAVGGFWGGRETHSAPSHMVTRVRGMHQRRGEGGQGCIPAIDFLFLAGHTTPDPCKRHPPLFSLGRRCNSSNVPAGTAPPETLRSPKAWRGGGRDMERKNTAKWPIPWTIGEAGIGRDGARACVRETERSKN